MADPVIAAFTIATLVVTVAIGFAAYRRSRTAGEYFAYGRRMTWPVLGLSVLASALSGFAFVGGPGLVYATGSASLWIIFPAALGLPLALGLVGRRLARYAADGDVFSLPDAVAKHYQSRAAQGAVAVGILVGIVAFLGAQMLAAGIILEHVFGLPFITAFIVATVAIGVYPLVGGIVAGVNTDILQGGIMLAASVLIFGFVLASGGGFGAITATVAQADQALVSPWGTTPPLLPLSWFLVFSIGVAGMPHVVSKALMVRDATELRRGLIAGVGATMLGSLLWMGIGFAMRARVVAGDVPPLAAPDLAAPTFLALYVPTWLAGITFAGLTSAILSTASTLLNVGAAAVTRDLPTAFGRPLARPVAAARVATAVLALGAAGVALASQELVALLATVGFGLHAAVLAPALLLGFVWPRATASGVVASVTLSVTGAAYFFLARQLGFADRFGWWVPGSGIATEALVLLASFLVFIIVSYATPAPGRGAAAGAATGPGLDTTP